MTKKELDGLIAAIPAQVKAAHAAKTGPTASAENGNLGQGLSDEAVIASSDYGFDQFHDAGYIRARSKEIARASLNVHAKPGSGVSHATKGDVGPIEQENHHLSTSEKTYGNTQGEN